MLKINPFATKFILLTLLVTPTITEYLEVGHFPTKARELIAEITMTLFIGIIIYVIYRKNILLESLSLSDHLTGINNRRMFDMDLKREILRSKRTNKALCVIFFDLDGFKEINDKLGHEEGDKVLIQFAQILSDFSREGTDNCYRFGGDEFAVLLTEIEEYELEKITIKIEDRLENEVLNKLPDGVSASKGVVFLNDNESFQELLKRADDAMYHSKRKRYKI